MDNLEFGFDAPQQNQDPEPSGIEQDYTGFGNTNWDTGDNPSNHENQFNATNVASQEQQDAHDAFGFGDSPKQEDLGQDGFGQSSHAQQPSDDAFGFDEPPKGDQVTNIGEDAEELALIEAAQRSMQERLSQLRQKEEQELQEK